MNHYSRDFFASEGIMFISRFGIRNLKRIGASSLQALICAWALAASAQMPSADDFNPGADDGVVSLLVQADERILISRFGVSTVAGRSFTNIARLNVDGTLDTGFNMGSWDNALAGIGEMAVSAEADGTILAGGHFLSLDGQALTNLARLNADGTLNNEFHPQSSEDADFPDGLVGLAVLADGKILVAEGCAWCNGALVRLNADGTKDSEFHPAVEYIGPASMVLQTDGKIIIGGGFESVAGQAQSNIARLNADGTLDSAFNPETDGPVYRIAVQADGKILVAGSFATVAGQPRENIARLNPDGTLDAGFNPGVCCVSRIALQTDGKIILGGSFTTIAGQPRHSLARLNADGTLDCEFNPGVDGPLQPDGTKDVYLSSVALQGDGKILVAGHFTTLGGQSRTNIGRLNNTGPSTQTLRYDGLTITWLRGGTSPEVWRTSFEASTNGTVWTYLGAGQRIPGGWQLTNVSVAVGNTIRAHGFVAAGGQAEGIVETTLPLTALGIGICWGGVGVFNNQFGFEICGSPGQAAVVESSTNLLQWFPLQTFTFGASPQLFLDPTWRENTSRFYRLRLSFAR